MWMRMYMYACVTWVQGTNRRQRGYQISWSWAYRGLETPDLNLRPLEEQCRLLTLGHLSILKILFSSRNPELCLIKVNK